MLTQFSILIHCPFLISANFSILISLFFNLKDLVTIYHDLVSKATKCEVIFPVSTLQLLKAKISAWQEQKH